MAIVKMTDIKSEVFADGETGQRWDTVTNQFIIRELIR